MLLRSRSGVLLGWLASLTLLPSMAGASTVPALAGNEPFSYAFVAGDLNLPLVVASSGAFLEPGDSAEPLLGQSTAEAVLPTDSDADGGSGLVLCILAALTLGTLVKAMKSRSLRKLLTDVYYPESY
jgi:hypothetical protein